MALGVLFVENDLGSSLLFFGIFVVMLWVATGRGTYLAAGIVLFAAAAFLGYLLIPHVQDRVVIWLHALQPGHVNDDAYQLAQGEFAMATGGVFGSGLGLGFPWKIPFAWTDFIFAALGEELGLFGVTAVLLLYVAICGRGLRTALARTDGFGTLLAVGLTTVVALQTFVIVGGVVRVIPLTGITLPFVSYGGSSLVTNFVLLALLVRVSAPSQLPSPAARGAAP
jgi:cell division protein FtsW (lipid II flippase)